MLRAGLLATSMLVGCVSAPSAVAPRRAYASRTAPEASRDAVAFLRGRLKPWPAASETGLLAITEPSTNRVAVYDSALVALVLLRRDHRDEAARILVALSALRSEDGALPAVQYLIQSGHRRIACIAGPLHVTNA